MWVNAPWQDINKELFDIKYPGSKTLPQNGDFLGRGEAYEGIFARPEDIFYLDPEIVTARGERAADNDATGGRVSLVSGYSENGSSGEILMLTMNGGVSGSSGAIVLSTGTTKSQSSGAVFIGTGKAV